MIEGKLRGKRPEAISKRSKDPARKKLLRRGEDKRRREGDNQGEEGSDIAFLGDEPAS